MSTDWVAWCGAILLLCAYSFLWKENRAFRIAEHIFIGAGAGHAIAAAVQTIKTTVWLPMLGGNVMLAIPFVLGILVYTTFIKQYAWIGRLIVAIPIGLGIGLSLRSLPAAQITSQVKLTIVPLNSLDNFIVVFGVIGTLAFFFFTTKQTPVIRGLSEVGKWTMMITFGLTFATSVFGQMSIYMGVMTRIFGTWLGLVK